MSKRSDALWNVCPACGAEPGRKCVNVDGDERKSVHRPRFRAEAVRAENQEITPRATAEAFEQGFADAARLSAAERFEWIMKNYGAAVRLCESPIETRFLGALMFAPFRYNQLGDDGVIVAKKATFDSRLSANGVVQIIPQAEIFGMRVDFEIRAGDRMGDFFTVVVECDGHAFHNTREKMERDRVRDRALLSLDCSTLRFLGPEIWRDAAACANQVADYVNSQIEIRAAWKGKHDMLHAPPVPA